jgi:hypothetical protein
MSSPLPFVEIDVTAGESMEHQAAPVLNGVLR